MSQYNPDNDPEDYEFTQEDAGQPNEDVQDSDVPDAVYAEAANLGEDTEADNE